MTGGRSQIVCAGCSAVVAGTEPYPFRCPRAGAGDDVDHVLRRLLDVTSVTFPDAVPAGGNPFVAYRNLFHSYHVAIAAGMADEEYVSLVRALDDSVAEVDGRGFAATPFSVAPALADAAALEVGLWVKDETRNVAGSHKARHLFGVLVHLEVAERVGLAPGGPPARLAIASCGNAALAAAVVAKAARRQLDVFVPTDADEAVVERLRALGAAVTECSRASGVAGDPTYLALRSALAAGAIPFTCQGNENGLAVEGAMTLAYEMAAASRAAGDVLDHVVVQVGGGALASAVAQGFADAAALGAIPRAPRLHTVQTEGAWPLARAFAKLGGPEAIAYAATHRSEFMWPWETTPRSVAHGILDDETYDWLAVCEAMLATGGRPIVVSEEALVQANRLATETTGIAVDETGTAGLAGLIELKRAGAIEPGERAAVLFTGARRAPAGGGDGR